MTRGRPFNLIRRAAAILLVALALSAGPALAQTSSSLDVKGVKVDVTAENAAAARERALAEGKVKAFHMLVQRMTLPADAARLQQLPAERIEDLVRDFSIAEEKASAVRYLSVLEVRFRSDAVRRLLSAYGVPFSTTPAKPVVVLPVLQSGGLPVLWEEGNAWREAWQGQVRKDGPLPFNLPAGDAADVATITGEQALQADPLRLAEMTRRYQAQEVIVAIAAPAANARTGSTDVRLTVNRAGVAPVTRTISGRPGESAEDVLKRAAASVVQEVETGWKKQRLMPQGQPAAATVLVPVGRLEEWLAVRRKLSGVDMVREVEVILVSRDEIRISLHYAGTAEQLVEALKQVDLGLSAEGELWILGPLMGSGT